jgi:hypothetical protein
MCYASIKWESGSLNCIPAAAQNIQNVHYSIVEPVFPSSVACLQYRKLFCLLCRLQRGLIWYPLGRNKIIIGYWSATLWGLNTKSILPHTERPRVRSKSNTAGLTPHPRENICYWYQIIYRNTNILGWSMAVINFFKRSWRYFLQYIEITIW